MSSLSLFPEVDEEIKQIRAEEAKKIQEVKDSSTRYIPSNGTEGAWFEDTICATCNRLDKRCSVLKDLYFGTDGSSDLIRYQDEIMCLKHSDFNIRDFLRSIA